MKKFDYDLAIIGSGAAGSTAALMAAGVGKKVALIEADAWGGSNVNRRDIPYAAATMFSNKYFGAIEAAKYGMNTSALRYNYPAFQNWVNVAKKRAGANSKKDFEEAGIDCISGYAQFISPDTLAVNDSQIVAKNYLITSGSIPSCSSVSGIRYWNSEERDGLTRVYLPEEVYTLHRIPKVVMIIGGGATGCETAEYLAEMGSKVIIAEISERLLPKEDPEVGEVIEGRFSKKLDIKVLTSARVLSVSEGGKEVLVNGRRTDAKKVIFMKNGQNKSVRVEAVVLAAGSEPALDLGLKNAKVKYTNEGITVNGQLQTSNKRIYAAGDCANVTGEKKAHVVNVSSSEKASYEAAMATSNIVNHAKENVDYRGYVRMTDTYPKIAVLGLTEDECIERDIKIKKILVPLSAVIASSTQDFNDGFVKIIINRERKIIGATVMAPNADIMIQELVIAYMLEVKIMDLASMPHVSSGWSEAIRIAARRIARA